MYHQVDEDAWRTMPVTMMICGAESLEGTMPPLTHAMAKLETPAARVAWAVAHADARMRYNDAMTVSRNWQQPRVT